MSKSLFVEFRNDGFWAFDVVSSVLLKHLVEVAATEIAKNPWLEQVVQRWRVDTIVPDFGFGLNSAWTDSQIEVIAGLIIETCRVLEARKFIPSQEIEQW